MGIATPAIIQKTSMKFLLFAVLLFIHAELQYCGKKYLVQTEDKGNKYDDDYRLRVGGSVKHSKFDTASDHAVEVKGDVLNSNVHNYAGAGRGKNGGLKVRGNVKWSDVDTASIHDASVDGNIYKSSIHNYGGKRYKKYGKYGKSKYGYGDDDDYRLTVDGDVHNSKFDTASDHEVRVKGNMKWTKAHNYGGAKGGKNDGLRVDGNVYKSDVDTADEHNASVGGSILNSNIHNYGDKKYEKSYKREYEKPYGKYD